MEDQSRKLRQEGSERYKGTQASPGSSSPSRNLEDAPGGPGQIQFVYENPRYMTSSPQLEYCDVDSSRSVNSLEFEEPIRLYHCTVSGCKVTCKRPYELKRHRQTVHNQSQHWFCPVDSCWLSCAFAGLAKISYEPTLQRIESYFNTQRRPLTCKLCVSSEDDGYAKLELNGFTRKDKLTKHLKKAHKDDFFQLGGTPIGKEYSTDRPLICDVQLFWRNPGLDTPGSVSATSRTWYSSPLSRLQLDDGTWSAYAGLFANTVAEAGFRCWTKQDEESFKRLGQDPKFFEVLPWQAHDLILKLGSDAPMPQKTALQDYQMQLMLLEQQNKKRLMMARQEQDAPMPKRTALQDYQMQLMLLEQQNKKRPMMARQEQDASSAQSHDPPLVSWTTETQYPSNGHDTTTSDVSAPPDSVFESASCNENLQHNASVSALSLGFESTPGPCENTQIDTDTLPNAGVEAEFAEFNWDALLSADLNSGSDSNYVALDNGENVTFEFDDSAFDSNNPAGDLDNLAFNFNDPDSVPAWYLDFENAAQPGL